MAFPAITTLRLLGPMTHFTDDKTEAKKRRNDLPRATKSKTWGMDLSTTNPSRNVARAVACWELSAFGPDDHVPEEGATGPSSEPFPSR